MVARLKDNLPELSAAVEKRFSQQRPHRVLKDGQTRIEIWDAQAWETYLAGTEQSFVDLDGEVIAG